MNEARANKQKPDEQPGLVCPKSGRCDFRVIYTRRACGGKVVRSRECRHCGKRVITYQRVLF